MKQYCRSTPLKDLLSHPAGVRGLKPGNTEHTFSGILSHPAGVRGLKRWKKPKKKLEMQGRTPQGCVG